MIINKIQKKKGKKNIYCIQTDNNESFEISDFTLGKFGLRTSDKISLSDIEKIKNAEEEFRARNIAINYLSYRLRSSKEVLEHLTSKGISYNCAKNVISCLQNLKMIDDVKFSYAFVRDKIKKKPVGIILLKQLLLAKGISKKIIDMVMKELYPEKEQETAAVLALKKKLSISKYQKTESDKLKKRLFDYLLRSGFSYEIAMKTIRQYSN